MAEKYAFAMVADAGYLTQVETLLKSIYLNVPRAVCYVLNADLPTEWFKRIRRLIKPIGGEIVDCRLREDQFDQYPVIENLSPITYARFMVPDYVKEDRVLYLDVDTLVTTDLSALFATDFGEYALAAAYNVTSVAGELKDEFNSGVLLLDCQKWRAAQLGKQLYAYLEQHKESITFADQQVLNEFFLHQFVPLDKTYNLMIGQDQWSLFYDIPGYEQVNVHPYPAIVHYVGPRKPWRYDSATRLMELWWYYRLLEWTTVVKKWQLNLASPHDARPKQRPMLLTLTDSAALETLEDLVQALPTYDFVIAAYTEIAPELARFRQYDNVTVLAVVAPELLQEYVAQADVYLDINYGRKDEQILTWMEERGIPVLRYADQANRYATQVIPAQDVSAMVAAIRQAVNRKD